MFKKGDFVSLIIEDSDELPVIGKVLKVDTEELCVKYWRGGYETKWRPWREKGEGLEGPASQTLRPFGVSVKSG